MSKHSKPIIATMINTCALSLTSYGVLQITTNNPIGYLPLGSGFLLELFKYWGMKQKLW